MSDDNDADIPPALNPRQGDLAYDLGRALSAVVSLRAHVPEGAFTASVLGTERAGHGVVIGEQGLIVTIGYLVTEADQIWIVDAAGHAVAGDLVAYDYETGFGLVRALGRLGATPLACGSSASLAPGTPVVMAGYGGRRQALSARVTARREFAGYWEYLLDSALFTSPPHPNWGGTAVIGPDGRLCAVGSLYLDNIGTEGPRSDGNMSVPIELLEPILPELLTYGRTLRPARPWLGMFVSEGPDQLVVAGVYDDAPASRADVRAGDGVLAVDGAPVGELAELFRRLWACGPAGTAIPLTLEREGRAFDVRVASVDRRDFWRAPALH